MTRNEMVAIVEALEQFDHFRDKLVRIGILIDMANYDKLLCLEELVRSKSRYADPEDDDAFEAFDAIMHAVNIDAAEKVRLLWIEK